MLLSGCFFFFFFFFFYFNKSSLAAFNAEGSVATEGLFMTKCDRILLVSMVMSYICESGHVVTRSCFADGQNLSRKRVDGMRCLYSQSDQLCSDQIKRKNFE